MDAELRHQMLLARELYQRHDYDRAEPLLEALVERPAGSAELCNLLGLIRHHRGRFAEAQALFAQALALNPGYTEAALNLAVVLNDTGHYTEAEERYQQALSEARPVGPAPSAFALGKLANLHAATAEAYRAAGMYAEAVAEYRRALNLCPAFPDLRCELARTLSEHGDHEAAIDELQFLCAQHPGYVQGHVLLGTELFARGRREEARAAWERALAADPRDRRVPIYLSWLAR